VAPALPASAFPAFSHLTQADFEAGKDNVTASPTTFTPFALDTSPASAACSANPNVRIEWRSYPTSSRLGFIAAIKCMMAQPPSGNFPPSTSRYEDFARLHQMYMPNIHGNPKFLIWHRYFLWTFEMALRDTCGFWDPLPWWDETLDAGNFHNSDMFTNTAYFGHLPGPDANVRFPISFSSILQFWEFPFYFYTERRGEGWLRYNVRSLRWNGEIFIYLFFYEMRRKS
jgi:tyrosinase